MLPTIIQMHIALGPVHLWKLRAHNVRVVVIALAVAASMRRE